MHRMDGGCKTPIGVACQCRAFLSDSTKEAETIKEDKILLKNKNSKNFTSTLNEQMVREEISATNCFFSEFHDSHFATENRLGQFEMMPFVFEIFLLGEICSPPSATAESTINPCKSKKAFCFKRCFISQTLYQRLQRDGIRETFSISLTQISSTLTNDCVLLNDCFSDKFTQTKFGKLINSSDRLIDFVKSVGEWVASIMLDNKDIIKIKSDLKNKSLNPAPLST